MLIKNEYLTKAAVTRACTHTLCLSRISPSRESETDRGGGACWGNERRYLKAANTEGGEMCVCRGGGGEGYSTRAQTTERRDMDD